MQKGSLPNFSHKLLPTIKKEKRNNKGLCSVSQHIVRNAPFLRQIASCRSNDRFTKLLSAAGPEQLLCLVECSLNLLRGRLPLSRRRLNRLRPHATNIRELSRARSAVAARRTLQQGNQTGAGVPLIASLVVGTLLPFILERVEKKIFPSESTN